MNWIALNDSILQWGKRLQRIYYSKEYERLREKLRVYETEAGKKELESLKLRLKNESTLKEILIFKPDDIGDAVYALPAIKSLKAALPQSRISLLCQKKTEPVYLSSKLFDEIVAVNTRTRLLRFQSLDLKSALDQFTVSKFDVAVFLRTYPAFFSQFKKLPAHTLVHPLDPRLKSNSAYQIPISLWGDKLEHQSVLMQELLSIFPGVSRLDQGFSDFDFSESIREEVLKQVGPLPAKYFVVHPYAKFETRRYPEKYWATLLEKISTELKVKLILIGGKEDLPWNDSKDLIQLQGKLSLGATGWLIKNSSGFIGNESGPGHWSSAMGIPTLMIMSGHSDLREWGPRGHSKVVDFKVSCAPCYLRACSQHKLKCLTQLTPESVLPRVLGFFQRDMLQKSGEENLRDEDR